MLEKARVKINSSRVEFLQADITKTWPIRSNAYDLVTFSLVLEHIENLNFIFQQAATTLKPGGYVYVAELHPFKQYSGSKARFDTTNGIKEVTCFTHHVSDFIGAAADNGLHVVSITEHFDDDDRSVPPRILSILFRRK